VTAVPATFELPVAGGRPDIDQADLSYSVVTGSLPLGLNLGNGTITGTAPFVVDAGTWYYGVFRFGLRIRDSSTGDEDFPLHRINVTINLSLVPPQQQPQAIGLNTQIRNAP
jgi:hypothetical protein